MDRSIKATGGIVTIADDFAVDMNCVRLYKHSPESWTLQLRLIEPLSGKTMRRVKSQVTSVNLTHEQLLGLMDAAKEAASC